MTLRRRGFTLVEIMIVVAIVGLLAAIAIPNFIKAREVAQRNACIANLKQIQNALQIRAIDKNKPTTENVTMDDLVPDYLRKAPVCPRGGEYNIYNADTNPTCSIAGHNL